MINSCTAAILAQSRQPLVIDKIQLPPELLAGQVLVKILNTTICGAQVNEIAAVKGPDKFLPHLLGHEASAVVMEVGPGVTNVAPGQTVVLHWRPSLGIQAAPPAYRWQGERLNAGWVTTFSEYAIVSENRTTPLPEGLDLRLASLFGCAITTAAGVVNNDAQVRVGDPMVVFGVGGVGASIVQFAELAGCYPIVAVDLVDDKLDMALKYGATHAFNGRDLAALDIAVREVVGARGAARVVETTGARAVIELAYELTHPEGRCVLVGVPNENVTIYTLPLHFDKVLTGSHGGEAKPHLDIPRLARLWQAGRLKLDGLITHEFQLTDINEAFDVVRSGAAGRVSLAISIP
jgi:S-(hydroxymethyl)glutathione dehydrogenase / alcohol dehydrogenase